MAKIFYFLLISFLLMNCSKEKTFADDIVLTFPKETKMKTQEFNEDSNEGGENLIYIGKIKSNIDVKYYQNILEPPPPPPYFNESEKDYLLRMKKLEDSIQNEKNPFFRTDKFPFLYSKNDNSVDSLSNKNLQIIVKQNDTIPLYKKDFDTKIIKKYYAFPVFIQNLSDKVLRIPTESKSTALYIYDDNLEKFYFARNSNYMICGMGSDSYFYFELKPNEILIYAYPYFKKGTKRKAKMKFYKASSKEFEISIDENIIKNQRNKHYE